ncbi:RodZ domain-containing protein [Mannheimia varigena]|uniref:RodZ domain-containing protein n=1 Tax=Mannheimia varigena TaxID=85404 RepID=UPI0015B4DAC6|nr:RodZ domain-containing protein [Mannheimia varigena]QLD32466.1 DUF4115 domain-containing protein [Mannheimia varigena]
MTESVHSTQEQPQTGLSLGQQLKAAREALNLSIADVVEKTNLKKSHIESIENDIFILKNVAPTFVRGYVRNYVKFLRLPESLVSSVNYGEVTIPKEITKVSPVKPSSNSQGKALKYLTIFVLLAALGMTLLWWWQGYQKDQENREQLVNSAPVAEITNSVPVESSNQVSVPVQQPIQVQEPQAQPQPETATVVELSQQENTPTQTVEPPKPEAEATATAEPVNVLQQTQTATEAEATTEQPTAVGNDELRIEITGLQSWITVRGAKNKRLAEKLYNNGETLTFNDNEQYRLTIGAPANVKLYYKGQEVPLKIDGRVARIRLPLQ